MRTHCIYFTKKKFLGFYPHPYLHRLLKELTVLIVFTLFWLQFPCMAKLHVFRLLCQCVGWTPAFEFRMLVRSLYILYYVLLTSPLLSPKRIWNYQAGRGETHDQIGHRRNALSSWSARSVDFADGHMSCPRKTCAFFQRGGLGVEVVQLRSCPSCKRHSCYAHDIEHAPAKSWSLQFAKTTERCEK